MSEEAKINVATGFQGGSSVALRADSFDEMVALVKSIYGAEAGQAVINGIFQDLARNFPEAGAVQNLQNGGVAVTTQAQTAPPAAPAAAPASTVGVPLAQPNAAPAADPPGLTNPGPCAHGPRVYKDTMARGAQWRRWECSIPWSRGSKTVNQGGTRCEPVDA